MAPLANKQFCDYLYHGSKEQLSLLFGSKITTNQIQAVVNGNNDFVVHKSK